MRSLWEKLHTYFERSISTPSAQRDFDRLKKRRRCLARFHDPQAFVDFARDAPGALDEKDAAYAALVREVQEGRAASSLATNLLWLGLWPGIDGVYQRWSKRDARQRAELVNLVVDVFEATVRRTDLDAVKRLAVNLVRDCHGELWQQHLRDQRFSGYLGIEASVGADDHDDIASNVPDESGESPDAVIGAASLQSIRAWLQQAIGRDADLVVGVLAGANQQEMAKRLGLTHDAARKRYQRALRRLATKIDRDGVPLRLAQSRSPSRDRKEPTR